jgi:hypothetical protein
VCLIALAAAIGFAVWVPRRSANDLASEPALVPEAGRAEFERSAA